MRLEQSFEAGLREALLEDVERAAASERDNLVFQAIQEGHEHLRAWGQERDYDVEPIIESLGAPEVERSGNSVTVRWEYDHPAVEYFEFGTSDHVVDGDPVLSFVWSADEAPRWVKKEFEREGDGYRVFFGSVEVSGIAETRFIRHSLVWLRRQLDT